MEKIKREEKEMTYNYPKITMTHADDLHVQVGKTDIHIITDGDEDVFYISVLKKTKFIKEFEDEGLIKHTRYMVGEPNAIQRAEPHLEIPGIKKRNKK